MGSKRQGERWWRQVAHGGCGYGYYYKSTLVTFVTFATVWIISWKAELTIQWLKEKTRRNAVNFSHHRFF